MITLDDYFQGRDRGFPPSEELRKNADETVYRVNLLLARYYQAHPTAEKTKVTSGYRPPMVNAATPGAAPRSKHLTCQAVDLSDPEGELDEWAFNNQKILEEVGIWMEHPACTKGWFHGQIIQPRSGRRVFWP